MFERFANPFIKHQLLSIALNSISKFRARVLPTILEFKEQTGRYPNILSFSLAALIAFYKTDEANDSEEIIKFMKEASVADILKREDYWGEDISSLYDIVNTWFEKIEKDGVAACYDELLK